MNPSALPLSARRLVALGVVVAGLIASPPPSASAQGVGQVNCAMAAKQAFGADDQQQIGALVASAAQELGSDDASVSQRGRDRLLTPLLCPGVSVAFRLEYGKAVEPAMAPMVTAQNDRVAVNALRVLGELRTSGSIRMLGQALQSDRAVIRFGAASGFRTLLSSSDAGFPEREIERALDAVRGALQREQDAQVADALVVALASTGASPDARTRAMGMMAETVAGRLKSLRAGAMGDAAPVWTALAYRAVFVSRQALIEDLGRGGVNNDFARSGAVLAGQVLAMARELVSDPGARAQSSLMQDLGGAVGVAEGLAVFSHNALTQQRINETNLRGSFESAVASGNPAPFVEAVGAWIGPAGRLTKAPYNAKPADFN